MEQLHRIEEKLEPIEAKVIQMYQYNSKAMLNTDQASSYLRISKSTLYKHTSAGLITYYKPNGKLIMFKREDLDQWLESKRIPSNDELGTAAEMNKLAVNKGLPTF